MAAKKRTSRKTVDMPWITKDGYFDPAKFPIDGTLKQTVGRDLEAFRTGCTILQSMVSRGRPEAGVYLFGLLRQYQGDLERLGIIVDKLRSFDTAECADGLVYELRRMKSTNTTRRYLGTVVDVLSSLSYEVVKERLEALAEDKSFSYKMR